MSQEDLTKLLVRVDIPDIKTQKCVVLSIKDTVWAAKQVVLDKINQDLPYNLLNYGLYLLPSVPGKLGKYMDDGRALGDYVLYGHVPRLEMRYKRRDYSIQVSLKEKDIIKANTKPNHRKFIEHVTQGSVKKVEKMLDSGIDPNFITEDGNTPLGIACGRNANIQVIMPLLSHGAHIDFRGKDGLTPLHRAALGGNSAAIKILLSYGASPNYRDVKGLTPLYHTAIMGDDTACAESLLRYRAELGIKDHGGWTELHQVTKYGHLDHADLLIKYGADLHAQNNAGNTALHVACSHGQSRCAMLLLTRGTDKTKLNFSNQLPAQVAILCGQHGLSAEISSFPPHQVDPIKAIPEYHPSARQFDPKLFLEQTRTEVSPAVPPAEMLVDTLTQEWVDKDVESGIEASTGGGGGGGGGGVGVGGGLFWNRSATGSSHSIPSMTTGMILQPHHSIETADSESLSSYDRDSIHSTSTTGTGTPGPNTPQTYHRRQPTFATQRERLYRAGPGRYMAMEDVEPQQSDDIPLRRGMDVEVVFIGKGGYWEGRAGGRLGWFPARAIQEITEDVDSGVYVEPRASTKVAMVTSGSNMTSVPENQSLPPPAALHQPPPALHQPDRPAVRTEAEVGAGMKFYAAATAAAPSMGTRLQPGLSSGSTQQPPTSANESYSNLREVIVPRSTKGYGFAMRGVKATKTMKFTPTPQVPALQYIGNVETGGSSDLAGLCTGDFLLEINGHNVMYSTHDDVVNIIRKAGKSLQMKVITPLLDPTLRTSIQLQKQVEISNSSNSLDRRDAKERDQVPIKIETLKKSPTSQRTSKKPQRETEKPQRETVIDDIPRQQTIRGQESPGLDRINQSGWDSSQDEATQATTGLSQPAKFSYLQPLPTTRHDSPQMRSATPPAPSSLVTPTPSTKNEPQTTHWAFEGTTISKSSTLPSLPSKDYPGFVDSSNSSENEEESDFTKALKKGKANLANSPALRQRSCTMPSKPLTTGQRSRLKSYGSESTQGHSDPTRTGMRKVHSEKNYAPAVRLPLAAALMRKIDSIQIEHHDEFSEEEEDTPPMRAKSYSVSQSETSIPPAIKPKPQIRRGYTVDPGSMENGRERVPVVQDREVEPSPTWHAELKKSATTEKQTTSDGEDSSDGESGVMNWKSVLRPLKRTESGRASPGPDDQSSRSNTAGDIRPVRHVQLKSSTSAPLAKVLESDQQNHATDTSRGQLYTSNDDLITTPDVYETTMQESLQEIHWRSNRDNKQAISDSRKPLRSRPAVESHLLPPPLPASHNLPSEEFVDLPPPVDFMSLYGVETGETSTDDVIPPPAHDGFYNEVSPSPPPPPPPDSSPPRESLDTSELDRVKFPTPEKRANAADHAVSPMADEVKVPSPIPSPLYPSSFDDADMESEALMPPQEFTHTREKNFEREVEQSDTGFEIPTPPELVSMPGRSNKNGNSEQDLDEAIRQLQQLSDNLSTSQAGPQQTSLKSSPEKPKAPRDGVAMTTRPVVKPEAPRDSVAMTTRPVAKSEKDSKMTVVDSPVSTPPVRRSSASSSNLSPTKLATESHTSSSGPEPKASVQDKPIVGRAAYHSKPVLEWEVEEVCEWLEDIGLAEHCPQFQENEILGEHLLELTKEELAELGVKKMGHKKTFLAKVKELTTESST